MSWNEPLPAELVEGGTFDALRHRLREVGYTEAALSQLLDIEAPSIRPQVSRRALIERLRGLDGAPPVLVRLFFLGDEVERGAVEAALGPELTDGLLRGAVLAQARHADGHLRAPVGITPCWGVYLLCDPLALDAEAEYGPGGPAMGPGADSETLLRTTPRGSVGRVLDLCTGPGTHALVAARHAESALGVDIAPRALTFARANARLNGLANVHFAEADLTGAPGSSGSDPLAAMYDLVLANPPFVPHPNPQFRYRDGGGPLGDEVLNAILRRLPALVAPGGQARIISDVAFRPGETLGKKLESCLGEGLDGWDVIGCEDAPFDLADYARFHSLGLSDGRMVQEPAAAQRLLDYYEAVGIARIAPVLLALHRIDGPGRRRFRSVSGVLALRTEHLDPVLALWDTQRRDGAEVVALGAVPTPAEGAQAQQRRGSDGGADVFEVHFGPDSPWPAFRTNADLFGVLMACDGRRSGAEVNDVVARARGRVPAQTRAFVTKVLSALAELGVIALR